MTIFTFANNPWKYLGLQFSIATWAMPKFKKSFSPRRVEKCGNKSRTWDNSYMSQLFFFLLHSCSGNGLEACTHFHWDCLIVIHTKASFSRIIWKVILKITFYTRGLKPPFGNRTLCADDTDVHVYWPDRWTMSHTWLSCTACPVRAHCHSGPTSRLQPQLWTPDWDCLKEVSRNRQITAAICHQCNKVQARHTHTAAHLHPVHWISPFNCPYKRDQAF